MSTGKRIAKRSIIGTRVCAPGEDKKYYSGVIQAVKTPANMDNSNCIILTPFTKYTVRFDSRQGPLSRTTAEYLEVDLIGPGFQSVLNTELVRNQKCFVTYKGREISGEVMKHHLDIDEVIIKIHPSGTEGPIEVKKKLDEVRLLESRKSARLADQDTDFARLADMAGDRRRASSHTIDVPAYSYHGSRKRRTSMSSHDDMYPNAMDECNAALVLMSLSCSPQSGTFSFGTSPGSSSSSSASFRSTPSPPPSNSPLNSFGSDEGVFDYFPDDYPRKKKNVTRVLYQCTFRGCTRASNSCDDIENHVRMEHNVSPKEEEFYYTEFEVSLTSPPPTLSHRDMARPPHEDPEYQRHLVGQLRQNIFSNNNGGVSTIPQSPHKLLKLSAIRPHSPKMPYSPRRVRGENKKCRKVYGMDKKEQWCTQCKWKKACTRFGD